MNNTVACFKTKGIIEDYAFSVFGVSAKESDNPIGRFGTGLKYAIAVTLRLGGEFTIYRGLDPIKFTAKDETFRGQEGYLRIYAGDTPLPFTTHLGGGWEGWQAYRELYSNTFDEGGQCGLLEDVFPEDGYTTMVVEQEEIAGAMLSHEDMFIDPSSEPLLSSYDLDVYDGPSDYLYFKGIRAMHAKGGAGLRYSLKEVDLTEDRTIKSEHSAIWTIGYRMSLSKNKHVVRRYLLSACNGGIEAKGYGVSDRPSDLFCDTVEDLASQGLEVPSDILAKVRSSRPVTDRCRLSMPYEMTDEEHSLMMGAVKRTAGFAPDITSAVDIQVRRSLPEGRHIFLDRANGVLYLSGDVVGSQFDVMRASLLAGISMSKNIDIQGEYMINELCRVIFSLTEEEL